MSDALNTLLSLIL